MNSIKLLPIMSLYLIFLYLLYRFCWNNIKEDEKREDMWDENKIENPYNYPLPIIISNFSFFFFLVALGIVHAKHALYTLPLSYTPSPNRFQRQYLTEEKTATSYSSLVDWRGREYRQIHYRETSSAFSLSYEERIISTLLLTSHSVKLVSCPTHKHYDHSYSNAFTQIESSSFSSKYNTSHKTSA